MSAGIAASPSGNRWKELYNAALFETDKNKLSERIAHAEWALALRSRELFHTDSEHLQERQAVDSAINALYALRMASAPSRKRAQPFREGSIGRCQRGFGWFEENLSD
jgi:hypothetical protein